MREPPGSPDNNFNRGYEHWLMLEAKRRNPSIELLNKIHFYGYQKLLKTGSYYIRTRAITSGQNFFISSEREKQLECESCSA